MEKVADRFREVTKPKKHKSAVVLGRVSLNSLCADVHYTITPCILLLFSLVVFYPFFITSPINCFVAQPSGSVVTTAVEESFLNNYCFSLSTYTVFNNSEAAMFELPEIYPGVGPDPEGSEQQRHNYYQFVPYVLLLQCVLFRLPYYWWKYGAHQENGLIRKLVNHLDDVETSIAQEMSAEKLKPSAPKPPKRSVHFFEPRQNSTQITMECPPRTDHEIAKVDEPAGAARKKLDQVVDYCYKRRGDFHVLAFQWLFCDALALSVTVFNFILIDWLLGGVFLTYGLSAMKLGWMDDSGQSVNFPRMTKCRLGKFGVTGSLENRDALCVLGMNLYFSYIFLFLWFWYLSLALFTIFSFFYKLWRLAFLKLWPECVYMSTRGTLTRLQGTELVSCMSAMDFCDIVFFCLLAQNLRANTYTAFVIRLATKLEGKVMQFAEV